MEIGGGAFATVYRVRQVSLDRWVALKMVREKDPHRRHAIVKEAKTQAQLHIDAIPQVYDTFEWRSTVCIVMQWIKGISLKTLMAEGLSDTYRCWLVDGFLAALASLHAQGYAHRDIKPENVLVSPNDGIFLVDFGFTKNVHDGEVSMAGHVKGTPAYMAPELWSGSARIDYLRADVYAAGKICAELLQKSGTGFDCDRLVAYRPQQRPENGVHIYREWQAHFQGRPIVAQWQELAAAPASQQLGARLFSAAHKLLYAGREEEAYWLLVECLQEQPNHARAVSLMESFPEQTQKRKRRQRIIAAAGTAAVCLLMVVAFLVGRHSEEFSGVASSDYFQTGFTLRLGENMQNRNIRVKEREGELSAAFRKTHGSANALDATLYLSHIPVQGSLYIDGKVYGRDSVMTKGLSLDFGTHTLVWRMNSGTIGWKEHVQLLPFERQGVHIDLTGLVDNAYVYKKQ